MHTYTCIYIYIYIYTYIYVNVCIHPLLSYRVPYLGPQGQGLRFHSLAKWAVRAWRDFEPCFFLIRSGFDLLVDPSSCCLLINPTPLIHGMCIVCVSYRVYYTLRARPCPQARFLAHVRAFASFWPGWASTSGKAFGRILESWLYMGGGNVVVLSWKCLNSDDKLLEHCGKGTCATVQALVHEGAIAGWHPEARGSCLEPARSFTDDSGRSLPEVGDVQKDQSE